MIILYQGQAGVLVPIRLVDIVEGTNPKLIRVKLEALLQQTRPSGMNSVAESIGEAVPAFTQG